MALAKASADTSSARKSPFESVSQTKPKGSAFFLGQSIARSVESDFSGRSDVSVRVPGVTMRDTLRSIMPLPGVPICSTMTTLSPSLTSFAM